MRPTFPARAFAVLPISTGLTALAQNYQRFVMSPLRYSLLLLVCAGSFPLFAQSLQKDAKEKPATVAGVVTLNGQPMRGVSVILQPQFPSGPSSSNPPRTKTDADGRFRLSGIAAGQYAVSAMTLAYVSEGGPNFRQGSGLPGKVVTLSAGETVENLELALKPGGVITGRVTDANGEPVVETNVQLYKIDDNGRLDTPFRQPFPLSAMVSRTDDRGVYRVFGLPAGKYKVSVGLPTTEGRFSFQTSRSFIPQTFHPDTTNEAEAKIIVVEEDREVADVDIKAAEPKKAYEISGRVVEADTGRPVAGADLSLGSYDKTGRITGSMSGGWRTDAGGEFQILGARPGKHTVFMEDREGKNEWYTDPTQVEVIDGDVAGIEVRAKRGVTISGTVVIEGTNDPAVLAKRSQLMLGASYQTNFSGYRSAKVSSDGTFQLSGLPPGKIRFNSYSNLPKLALVRMEQNGAPVKDLMIETQPGQQVTVVRAVYGYSDGTIRGQVKIIGGELPEGVRFTVSVRRTDGATSNMAGAQIDERGQFLVRDLPPGEYEVRMMQSFSGRPTNEVVTKDFPRIAKALAYAKQTVMVTNGNVAQTTFTVDLSQEN